MTKKVLILFSVCALWGCQSADVKNVKYKDSNPVLYGMVYDYDNSPVPDASIFANGKYVTRTDVQGRFMLTSSAKKHEKLLVRVEKDTYEAVENSFLNDPMNVLYFRLPTASQLLVLAEESLDNHLYEESTAYLTRAAALAPHRSDIVYLHCVVLYRQGKTEEALQLLYELKKKEKKNIYVEEFIKKLEAYQL